MTWLAWLKNAKSGRRWTFSHGTGRSSFTKAVSLRISGASVFTCEWQFRQTLAGGTPACRLRSAPAWQYWQSSS